MRVVVVGANGGIGRAVCALLTDRGDWVERIGSDTSTVESEEADAIVCCNGSHERSMLNNFHVTQWFSANVRARILIAMCGGAIGGTPATDVPLEYVASKGALAVYIESCALRFPSLQFFCVAPGLTATKMTGYKGVDPRVPAAFIVKLLSGKYGHLSGSLLAAQRDDLDTMKPMKLRRVECP
jgi:NAD(P)-dependent dehydrogenase (short-subunit alcohol dehydrogenase family)